MSSDDLFVSSSIPRRQQLCSKSQERVYGVNEVVVVVVASEHQSRYHMYMHSRLVFSSQIFSSM